MAIKKVDNHPISAPSGAGSLVWGTSKTVKVRDVIYGITSWSYPTSIPLGTYVLSVLNTPNSTSSWSISPGDIFHSISSETFSSLVSIPTNSSTIIVSSLAGSAWPSTTVWTTRSSTFGSSTIYALAYGNGIFVAGGASGQIRTSTDAITWTPQTSNFGTSSIYALAYGNELYVAAGQNGTIRTSTDAITWTTRTSGTTALMFSVAYGNGLYVAAGDAGQIRTSTDGITWTTRTSGTTDSISSLAYGGGMYVGVGGGNTSQVLVNSTDGITWTTRVSENVGSSRYAHTVTYADGFFIVGYRDGQTETSTDGITWKNTLGYPGAGPLYASVYGNGVNVVGDTLGNIFSVNDFQAYVSAQLYSIPQV